MIVMSMKLASSILLFKLLQFSAIYGHAVEINIFNATVWMHSVFLLMIMVKKMFQAFGMTETTGGHVISRETDFRLEAAGRKREGIHSKILNPGEDRQGEVRHSFPLMLCVL